MAIIQEYHKAGLLSATNAHPERTTLSFQILIMLAKIYDILIHGWSLLWKWVEVNMTHKLNVIFVAFSIGWALGIMVR